VGWFTCALFASGAYSWTCYCLLAQIVARYELARVRLSAAHALEAAGVTSASVPTTAFSSQRVMGVGMSRSIA
jgi:hypothetical protein